MCGINGLFAYGSAAAPPSERELIATRDHMAARGPDGVGAWWSSDRRVGFGHRRLSIIDLSARADQPMVSADGRLVVVFNGEIYNYPALRAELEKQGHAFRTNSDTEALLHLYAQHGQAMTARLRGMFAFAIYDLDRAGVFLARDGHGIKPLYVADDGATFRFASQVKALLAGGGVSTQRDPAGMVGFYLWGSVPEPYTLYKAIRQVPAGTSQWVDRRTGPQPYRQFASVPELLLSGTKRPIEDAPAIVSAALRDSVAAHLLADVDVGLFLSGGIDSGALLGLMSDAGQTRTRTITLRFAEFVDTPEDESVLASAIAKHYGASHAVRTVSEAEFKDDLPAILAAMDQPSIDGVNTWFVAKAAKELGLKVALSGIGGDELFAGYPSFGEIPRWVSAWGWTQATPGLGISARIAADALGIARDTPKATSLIEYGANFADAYFLRRALWLPHQLQGLLSANEIRDGLARVRPRKTIATALENKSLEPPICPITKVATLESTLYMRNQLLRDADWAGMAHSIEVRTPLVDTELTAQLAPVVGHFGGGNGKAWLSQSPQRALPKEIRNRPKTGFGVPTGQWLANAAGEMTKGAASRVWARRVLADQAFA